LPPVELGRLGSEFRATWFVPSDDTTG